MTDGPGTAGAPGEAPPRYTPDGQLVPPPSASDVLYEPQGPFCWITLNRPLVLNAIDWSVRRQLARAIEQAGRDEEVRAVVLRGAGRAFCAGGDMQASPEPPDGVATPGFLELVLALWNLEKPVIAAVRGHAVGLGCELAGACDLAVASEDARLGEIQIRHGYRPPVLIAPFLTGLRGAKELLLLGGLVGAEEALRLGLINRVVPGERLEEAAAALALRLAALPDATVRLNKLLVNRVYELAGFREALGYMDEPDLAALAEATGADPLARERLAVLREQGWRAFVDRRDAAAEPGRP